MRLGAVLADPEPMLARLVRRCIALAVTARVRADACSHRLADTVKGGELSYMALAMEREQITYSSLLRRPDTIHADPEAICKLAWHAARSPKLAFLPLVQLPPAHASTSTILDGDTAACIQRVNASKPRTDR